MDFKGAITGDHILFLLKGLLITLEVALIAIVLSFISNIFKLKGNIFLTYLITIFIVVLFGSQIVYYSMYESILSFYSIVNGGQVTEFMDVIFDMILRNIYSIIILALPIIILIILHLKKAINFERMGWKGNLIKIAVLLLVQVCAIICVNYINTDELYSNKNLYYNRKLCSCWFNEYYSRIKNKKKVNNRFRY